MKTLWRHWKLGSSKDYVENLWCRVFTRVFAKKCSFHKFFFVKNLWEHLVKMIFTRVLAKTLGFLSCFGCVCVWKPYENTLKRGFHKVFMKTLWKDFDRRQNKGFSCQLLFPLDCAMVYLLEKEGGDDHLTQYYYHSVHNKMMRQFCKIECKMLLYRMIFQSSPLKTADTAM